VSGSGRVGDSETHVFDVLINIGWFGLSPYFLEHKAHWFIRCSI